MSAPSRPEAAGRVEIADEAIAQLVALAALECDGVVGLTTRERGGRAAAWLRRDAAVRVDLGQGSSGLLIDCSVAIEHGLNLAQVLAEVRRHVREEVERLTGIAVDRLDVHVAQLRRTRSPG
ncbi:MAG: hypothetical protein QOK40_733 [Miltoncostaeaceae bacterium]|nr:hypothetical protein [Miltoncostaeaceae bacterium]